MIFNALSEVLARFLSSPLVGIKCTVVSQASAHSRVNTHTQHFKGPMYAIYVPCRSKSRVMLKVTGYYVFDTQFINDCARTQFTYVLMRFSQKRERMSTISRSKQKSEFLRQVLKTRDSNELTSLSFTLVHRSEQGQV